MKRLIIALLGLSMLAFVGACSGAGDILPKPSDVAKQQPSTEAPEAAEAEPPTPTEEPEDSTNERGNIEFAVGDTMGLNGPSGDLIAEVTVTGLEFITCQSIMGETGNPLLVSYSIETSADASRSDLTSVFNPYAISLYDSESGLTTTPMATMPVCVQKANELHVPTNLSPGSNYSGGLLFPEAPESGAVIYTPAWSANGAEWAY